jgi:hypothetical protein
MMGYRAAGRFTWDAMALVRYPSRQAFASMVKAPDYREKAGPLGAASLAEAVFAAHPHGPGADSTQAFGKVPPEPSCR